MGVMSALAAIKTVNLTFGKVYGGGMWDGSGYSEREIWEASAAESGLLWPGKKGGEYALIPVEGSGTITPIIYGDKKYVSTVEVWTDSQLFETFTPKGVSSSEWENDYDCWEYESGRKCYSWPKSVWPDNKVVSGRRWIVVGMSQNTRAWAGRAIFRVGVVGGSELSESVVVKKAEANLNPPLSDFFHGMSISGIQHFNCFDGVQRADSMYERPDGTIGERNIYAPKFEFKRVEGKALTFNIEVPSAGTLVVSSGGNENTSPSLREVYSVTGNNILTDVLTEKSDNWGDDNFFREETNFWKTSNAPWIRRVEVSAKTTLKFTRKLNTVDGDCEFHRMYFFPRNEKSVAVGVDYVSVYDPDVWWEHSYLQGYVKGMGVYKSGETATLTAVPGEGEQFDHWEVCFGNLELTESQRKSATLSFKVTDAMCGNLEDEEQIYIQAVWKPKYSILALPSIGGAGTVTGSGIYYEDDTVTLTAKAAVGCTFVKWSDGETAPTRTITVVPANVERVIFACFEAPNGVPNPTEWIVTFDANGGDVAESERGVKKGTAIGALPTATRSKYKFIGWYTAPEGGTKISATTKVTCDITYYAQWIYDGSDIILQESYGPFVPGTEVELNLGLVGYTAKKLPSGLKLDKKTGVVKGKAKKPGEYQVTFTKKGTETLTAKFIVGPMPTITITMEGDIEKCKVTGASKPGNGYLVGKKISLSAKGPKGTAFTGWFKDGAPWPNETEYLESKLKYVMTEENLSLVARFEKEKMSVACDGLSALAVGEEVALPIAIETQSGVKSVQGSKLPTGLKVKKDKASGEWFVTGKPKKVGAWNSVIKVTAKSGAVEQLPVTVTVEDKGEVDLLSANHYFREPLKNGKGEKYVVSVGISNVEEFLPNLKLTKGSLNVSGLPAGLKYDAKTGKITGIATKAGTYTVTLTVTDGKAKYVSTITIEVEALPDWVVGTFHGYIDGSESYAGDWVDWVTITINSSGKVSYKDITEDGSIYVVNPKDITFILDERGDYIIETDQKGVDWYNKKVLRISYVVIDGITVGVIEGESKGADIEDGGAWIQPCIGEFYACQNVWEIAKGTKLTPTLVENSTTSVSMNRMRDDDWDPYYGGYLTLKYGVNGAVTTVYSESDGGKATATGSAQLVPYEVDGNITKAWLYTALKPKDRDSFGVLLFLSIDTSNGNVYGDDVAVEDYLLEVDD